MRSSVARRFVAPEYLGWAFVGCIALAAAGGGIAFAGTRFGTALALAAIFGPIIAYAALRAPLIFPFAAFVLLVPFDNLLSISSFGTLTKLLLIATDCAMGFWFLRTRRFISPDRSLVAWLVFVLWVVASFSWAADAARGLPELASIVSLFVVFALLSFAPVTRHVLHVVIGATIFGGTIAGAYGGYLFRRGVDVSQDGRLFIGNHAAGSSIDPNHFGAALLLPFVLAITMMISVNKRWLAMILAAASAIIALGIFVSGSRGDLVAAGCMFVYLLVRSKRRVVLAGIGLGALACCLAAFGQIVQRFSMAAATGGAGRLGIWRVGFAAFKQHVLAGVGIGNFAIAYNDAFLSVAAFSSMAIVEGARWSVAPHNNLVWVGVELGIVGIAMFLTAWWLQFRSLRIIPEGHVLYPIRLALEGGILGMFVCGLFLGTMTYKYLWLCFMLVVITRNTYLTTRREES